MERIHATLRPVGAAYYTDLHFLGANAQMVLYTCPPPTSNEANDLSG